MSLSPWRATCIQMPSELVAPRPAEEAPAIIQRNLDTAVRLIRLACDGDAPPKLVVLPEFALQGPPHGMPVEAWIERACGSIPGPMTAPLQAIAAEKGVYVAGNLFERDDRWPGRFFNTCFLIDDHGEVILRYRRINTALWPSPHDFMDDYLNEYGIEGTFPVVDTPLGRLALIACGEISVPEVVRCFMLRGAEVLIHPTNEERSPGQEAAKVARASENMMYVVSANVAGGIGFSVDGSVVGGRSHIIDFRGRTMAYQDDAAESTSVSTLIDIEAVRAARRDLGLGNTLLRTRWEIYQPLFSRVAIYPPNGFLAAPMRDSAETRPLAETSLCNLETSGAVL